MSLSRHYQTKNAHYAGPGENLAMCTIGGQQGPFGYVPSLPIGNWYAPFIIEAFRCPASSDSTQTTTNSGTIGMAAGGLALVSGASNTNNTTLQMLRAFTVTAGKRATMFWRQNMTNIAKGKAANGFFLTGADPIGTIPVEGAWFEKTTAGTGAITARTTHTSTATTSAALQTAVNSTDIDFCILINGVTNVQFWTKLATAESWGNPTTSSTNLPAATQVLRPSFNITATDANALTTTFPLWGFSMEY